MKLAILGTGVVGKVVAREIVEASTDIELLLVDANVDSATSLAASLGEHITAVACDAHNQESLCQALNGVDLVVNAAQYEVNSSVMRACLTIGAHYMDLGGLFHETKQQQLLHDQFQAAGLTAVIGMGAAPGMTNILAQYIGAEFDSLEAIDACAAAGGYEMQESETGVFIPPYSIQTLLAEFGDPSFQFVDGKLQEFTAKSGRQKTQFIDPIGNVDCFYTLHSEPATLPDHFLHKGIRRVTWRLALPKPVETVLDSIIATGLASNTPIEVNGYQVSPLEVLSSCLERNAEKYTAPSKTQTVLGCIRVEATGIKDGVHSVSRADMNLEITGQQPNVSAEITGRPAAMAALLILQGEASLAGVHGPEALIPGERIINALKGRGFDFVFEKQA
jgi:saccharopine dehydrogenase-like NADP-dependent oxidoreductase